MNEPTVTSTTASNSNADFSTRTTDLALAGAALVCMLAALYAVFIYAPTDSRQGPVQKIFYVHMAMWLPTFTAFALVGLASLLYLRRRTRVWDRLGRAAAEVGLLFCTLGLITGSIWAKPIWGTWWTWDPRLTLTLILWMIYATYLLLRTLSLESHQGSRLAAVLGVSGIANLYLINRAVYWWRGIHPAVIQNRQGGSGLHDPAMQITLVVCLLAFALLFAWLLRIRIRTAALDESLEKLREELRRE